MENMDAATTQDMKCGMYTIVWNTFFSFKKTNSFNSTEMITAAPVFKISFVILSTSVLLNAFQNPGILNIFAKCFNPTKIGSLIPL